MKRFLARYSLVSGYILVRQLLARGAPVRLRRDLLLNYAVPLGIAVWGAGERRRSPRWYGLSASNPRKLLVHSAIGAALGSAFVLGPTGKRMLGPRDEWERRLASFSPVEAFVLFSLTGLTEETIWRGWTFSEIDRVFSGRSKRERAAAAICGSAFLFSSLHLVNLAQWPRRRIGPELQQMVAAAALGLIGGYWRQATGSIIPGMVMHNVANLLRWRTTRQALMREQAEPQVA